MAGIKVGTYNYRTHATEFEIGPYGWMDIGRGIGTLTLADCNAPAVQIVSDGRGLRCDLGATVPYNGTQNFIRNPYATTIKGATFRDNNISFAPRNTETAPQFTAVNRLSFAAAIPPVAGRKQAVIFKPKRGQIFADLYGNGTMNVSVLSAAKDSYLDQLTVGTLEDDLPVYNCDGARNDNIVARIGSYTDLEVSDWITTTGWNRSPVEQSVDNQFAQFTLDENTAAIVFFAVGDRLEISARIYDQGDWLAEFDG